MTPEVDLTTICAPSEDVVAREIEGELVIVPLVAGIGDAEELYTLNPTAQAIWQKLDGQRTLKEVAAALVGEFHAPLAELEADVLGFASEMSRRGILAVKPES
jgi:cobalamin biosynthesis protein CbiG